MIVLISVTNSTGQDLHEITRLPPLLKETSGIEITSENRIWSFNDSGGEPELYLFDTMGNLLKTLAIENAWNRDWEDLTQDTLGNFYIGNIGNNNNDNMDLTIFKVPNPDRVNGLSVRSEIISFSYEDQFSFPPPEDSLIYDCEALMWHEGFLYLSTKNRTIPFDGKTHLYQIPDAPGTYVAKKVGVWDSGGQDVSSYWITAGDISDDGTLLTLLSGDKMWLFYDFPANDFFSGRNIQIDFSSNTQKEGICFVHNAKMYITDEEWFGGIGRKLYSISLDPLTSRLSPDIEKKTIKVVPNPCRDEIFIDAIIDKKQIVIYDAGGKRLHPKIQHLESRTLIDTKGIPPGVFFVKIVSLKNEFQIAERMLKLR